MRKRIVDRDGTVTRWYDAEQLEAGTDLPSDQVAHALWDLRRAESRGFLGCQAVFVNARYDGLHERIRPDSDAGDYGRGQRVTYRNVVVDGKLVRDPEYPLAPCEWRGEASGYAAFIRVNWGAARCGYVTVPVGHPAHGKHYDSLDVSVHGGLTYAAQEDDGGWTFGFDCSHYGDAGHPEYVNGDRYASHLRDGVYRSFEYVRDEIESLARQLREMEAHP